MADVFSFVSHRCTLTVTIQLAAIHIKTYKW